MVGWASMYRFLEKDYDPFDMDLKSAWPLDELKSEEKATLTPAV